MIKIIKSLVLNCLTGANMAIVGLLLFSGYSDRINPEDHQLLACAGMTMPFFALANLVFVGIWVIVCWRRLWVPLLGFALAYGPIRTYMPLHFKSEMPEDDVLRVVSWNLYCYKGIKTCDKEHAFDSVFQYARRQNADILCAQEDAGYKYAVKRYAEFFPYNDTTNIISNGKYTSNTLGIHSRYPILRKEAIKYESKGNGSVAYYLQIQTDTVLVIVNHLETTHLPQSHRERYKDMIQGEMPRDTAKAETKFLLGRIGDSMAKRAPQARAVHEYIEGHRQYPMIVCGDFNDTPISYARHTIAQGLTDCYVETGNGPGLSYNLQGFYFRIDHMFVSDHFTPYGCKVDSKIDVSDHYPIVCTLKKADKP